MPDALVRLVLVWDTQTNGAQLNGEDVMEAIGATEDFNSFRNLQYSKRFIVLKDKKIRIPVAQTNMHESADLYNQAGTYVPFKINKKFSKPIKVRCTGTSAAVSAVSDNSLHLLAVSTQSTTDIWYQSRVRFSG